MSHAHMACTAPGHYTLHGKLTFSTVNAVLAESHKVFDECSTAQNESLRIDLSGFGFVG